MARDRLFASLCSMAFLVNLVRVVYAPLVEPLQAAFSAGPGTIGLIITLVWAASALPRVPVGYLLTILPRHRVVLLTGTTLTLAALATTLADSVLALAVGSVLIGTATSGYFVAANPLISELYTAQLGRMIGIHGTATQVAAVVAAPFAALTLVISWRAVFAVVGVATALSTVALYRTGKRTEFPAASGVDRDFVGAIRAEWPLIALGIALFGATSFVWQGLFNFYPSYLETARGIAPGTARTLLTVVFAAGVPSYWASGYLVERVPTVPYLFAIIVAFIGCVLALTVTTGVLAIAVLSAVVGWVIYSLFPAADAFLLTSFPDEHRGGAYATFSGGMMFVQALGSWAVGGLIGSGFGYDAVFRWLALALAGVTGAIAVVVATGRRSGSVTTRF